MGPRQSILLIRLKSIGDILFTLPAVHQVRHGFPDAHITFLVSKEHAPLLSGFRGVDEIKVIDRGAFRNGNLVRMVSHLASLMRDLSRRKFCLAIDFQGYGETALLARWTRATKRCGAVREGIRQWAYTTVLKRDDTVHPADFNLRLVWEAGIKRAPVHNEFVASPEACSEARALLLTSGLDATKPFLCIQPFTSTPEKNWPLEHYVEVARSWKESRLPVIFICGRAEGAALASVHQAGFPVFAGAPLLAAAGLMKASSLVLGGDTGLLHLAVAMRKRVVMLMNYAGPGNSYPFAHQDWAVVPVPGRKVATVSPEQVKLACQAALAREWNAQPQ